MLSGTVDRPLEFLSESLQLSQNKCQAKVMLSILREMNKFTYLNAEDVIDNILWA